ncbi:hypothetical protein ACLMJK_001689 [Lecanora helva]
MASPISPNPVDVIGSTVLSNNGNAATNTLVIVRTIETSNGVATTETTYLQGIPEGAGSTSYISVASVVPAPTSSNTTSYSSVSRSSASDPSSTITSTHSIAHSGSKTSTAKLPSTISTHPINSSSTATPDHNRLSGGTTAGIVVASAIGLALISSLVTFLLLRHRYKRDRQYPQGSQNGGEFEPSKPLERNAQKAGPELKVPLISETLKKNEGYLPEPADDVTIQKKARTIFDQIEVHVENFYHTTARYDPRQNDSSMAKFESPSLNGSLSNLLLQRTDGMSLLKQSFVFSITSRLSLKGDPNTTLLPPEFMLTPNTLNSEARVHSTKPGKPSTSHFHPRSQISGTNQRKETTQAFSRWRVLTAYLWPSFSQSSEYVSRRDHRISECVHAHSQAFAPWRNLKYRDEEQAQSLSEILKSAADFGIWIFSQPSDIRFQWPPKDKVEPSSVALTPVLIKKTDEWGRALSRDQIMLEAVIKRLK